MPWQAPQFAEVDMNAEIGAYQRDPLSGGAERLRPPPHGGETHGVAASPAPQHDSRASSRR